MKERLINLFGLENLEKIKNTNILLVGIGGVGSFCFEELLRCGVENITIIDFDVYEESNLNRQLYATLDTIGKKKIESAYERGKSINKNAKITILDTFLNLDSDFDFSSYDYIIDACDSVPAKAGLIINANKFNKKIIVSLGIGNRLCPQMVCKSTLKESLADPLGKKLNHYLIKKCSFDVNVPVICSKEKPIKSEPVSSYVCTTSVAGILLCDYVIKDIINNE